MGQVEGEVLCLKVRTSSGASLEVRKFSIVSSALTPALAIGSWRMYVGSVEGSVAIFHL